MSEKRTYNLTCRGCGTSFPAELYESINVEVQPELKEQLMGNQLNMVECPKCQARFRVDKPLLYSDPPRRLLIYWLPVDNGSHGEGEEQFSAWMRDLGTMMPDNVRQPDVHLVFSRTEMVERIFLAEAGLNERIIEYLKYSIFSKNMKKVPPESKALLFNAQDSTEAFLCFVVQDVATRKLEAVLQYPRETYNALREAFDSGEKSADLLEMFPGPYISARELLLREMESEKASSAKGPGGDRQG